jgi:hypothetical protein
MAKHFLKAALKPYHQAKHIGWTHYGVMIPELPAPHQFFSTMSVIGTPGALVFDTDHVFKDSPRNNATAVMGTAATYQINSTAIQFLKNVSYMKMDRISNLVKTLPLKDTIRTTM